MSPETPAADGDRPRFFRRSLAALRSFFTFRWLAWLRPSHPTLLVLFLLLAGTSLVLALRNVFLHHVPSGHMLVVVAKFGAPLAEGQILAGPGQKGIREEVLGEGWHFIWPILYETEIKPNIVVPGKQAGAERPKVGIVKALGGTRLPPGQFLATKGQQGIWREVLLPGAYRLNPYGYEVKLVDMVEVKPGFVGVMRRKLGEDGPTEFATRAGQKGIVRDQILQPGLYPINTEEYAVVPCPVGIYQTTFHHDDTDPQKRLEFDASDSNRIQLDCTIEWELQPEHWPVWLTRLSDLNRIETTVIKLNVKNISRNKGQNYGAADFLDGSKREQFQTDFMRELEKECMEHHIIVRHAFIRNIIIPDAFLKLKRDVQLSKEEATTRVELTLTAETFNDVVAAERNIAFEVAKVEATTEKLVAVINQQVENLTLITDATIEKMKDENAAKVALINAERQEVLGRAEAESQKLVSTAKSGLHKLQMDVFRGDSESFLRYTMSQTLNQTLRLRLFQSGPGTFWTNMGDKSVNLVVPTQGGK